MKGIRCFIAVGILLAALMVASAATAKAGPVAPAPTLTAAQVACPSSYEGSGSCVEVAGCNYGNSGVLIVLKSPGAISLVSKAGTTGGCFDTTVVGVTAGSWSVTASAPNGGPSASTTVLVS